MSKELLFSFNTPSFPQYNFQVISFNGHEEIGELYEYDIDLISSNEEIDFDEMLTTEVSLQLHNPDGEDRYIHGVLEFFEAHQKIDENTIYKARLVPKLWQLSQTKFQQIFLNKNIPTILETLLKDAYFTSDDYIFNMQNSYENREYICQYKESQYDFFRRWIEREGIYFYFKQDENGCKLIVTDNKDRHEKSKNSETILYKPASGLQEYNAQAVSSIVYRSNKTINSVLVKNYNYNKPSLNINSSTDASNNNSEIYYYGNNVRSQEEAQKLSKIHTEKYKCLAKEMIGESNIVSLSPGDIFTLSNYFKESLNGDYLMIRVESQGSQKGSLSARFEHDTNEPSFYSNSFMMIPSSTQFRMQTTTATQKIEGVLSAIIDGQGSGDTAELDKFGRYKVIMPFDLSGRKNAKASAYLRMAQPSAGEKQGTHFPLHKGVEVLITFKGGDPDQPVITGAVPNLNTPSPVTESNLTKSIIQTHSGHTIELEDATPNPYIKLSTPLAASTFLMSSESNSSSSEDIDKKIDEKIEENNKEQEEKDEANEKKAQNSFFGLKWETEGGSHTMVKGNEFKFIAGGSEEILVGDESASTLGAKEEVTIGALFELQVAMGVAVATKGMKELTTSHTEIEEIKKSISEQKTYIDEQVNMLAEDIVMVSNSGMRTYTSLKNLIESEIRTVTNETASITSSIRSIGEHVSTIESQTETIESDIRNLSSSINTIESQVNNISSRVDNVESEIANHETMVINSTSINITSTIINIL
ncbi:MAG: type VI secretion system tip protein TssI/VgrG [Campylobacterota bacterium]|nr:type VI secretion system tip protein TssI/VgrG [Campylobacterota bacterium]